MRCESGIRADAATRHVAIESASGGWCSERRTWIDASTLIRNDAENFIVAEARFKRRLDDKVRRVVRRIQSIESVVSAAIVSRPAEEEVRWRVGRRKCNLRIFDRGAEPELVIEVLGNTEPVLARPAEAHRILRINRHRQRFGPVIQSLPGFRD